MSAVRLANQPSSQSMPQGFEFATGANSSRRVKLRRALHRGSPLGITIFVREGNDLARIDQFDIATSLDAVTRPVVENLMLEVFQQLGASETYELGLKRLGRMHEEGFCVSCSFAPVRSR